MNIKINTRTEKDLLGFKEIPSNCYYGVQTLRALENFNLSPNKLNQFPVFINALAMVKAACAEANFKLNKLISTNVTLDLLYDHDQIKRLQMKQTLGIGFSYNLGLENKEKPKQKILKPFVN